MERETSNILVHVLNLDDIKEAAFNHLLQFLVEDNSVLGFLDNGPFGLINTKQGSYIINHIGQGVPYPITNTRPFFLQFYTCLNSGGFIPNPAIKLPITVADLPAIPIVKTVTLDEFIVKYTQEQEDLYKQWVTLLSPISTEMQVPKELASIEREVKEDCLYIRRKEDLKKYKTFLTDNVCQCNIEKPLFEVAPNICCINRKHKHCASCGGVI
jgi:hypothetical protein